MSSVLPLGEAETTKDSLHRLVDELPDVARPEAERYLAAPRDDPLALLLLTAPVDDEPESDEERRAVQKARKAVERGEMSLMRTSIAS